MMVWERLRVFAAVAEHGSVTAAAAALHITGPAVTQQIRKLERETHSRLVEPDGRGIRLTAAGHVLAGSARRVAATVAEAERDLATLHGHVVGPLRIGAVASALRALLPGVLRTLTAEHPRLVPTVRDGEVIDLLPALRNRDLDAVLLESWSHRPARIPGGVRVTTLVTEPVLLAVPDGHPLAGRVDAPLDELAGQTWASCPVGTEAYEGLVQVLRAHNLEPDVRYLVADFTTQLHLVAAGLAVATVPAVSADPAPPGVRLLACRPALGRTLAVATREPDDTPSRRALVEALREAARPLQLDPDAAPHVGPGRARASAPGPR